MEANALIVMLRNVVVFAALALPGFILVKNGHLKQEQSGILSKLMMYIGIPFLILSSTIDKITFSRELLISILLTAVIGIVYTLIMFLASTPLTATEKTPKHAE